MYHVPNKVLSLSLSMSSWAALFHSGPLVHSFLLFLDVTLLLEKRGGLVGTLRPQSKSHTSCVKHFPSLVSKKNLITSSNFSKLWRTAKISLIPKGGSPSQFHLYYRPISIMLVIFNVYESLSPESVINMFIKKGFFLIFSLASERAC